MKCNKCGKGSQSGNLVSHAKNRTKRRFKPNLKKVTLKVDGIKQSQLLCISCLRMVKKKHQA